MTATSTTPATKTPAKSAKKTAPAGNASPAPATPAAKKAAASGIRAAVLDTLASREPVEVGTLALAADVPVKKARGAIDSLRRSGYSIAATGKGTFKLLAEPAAE